MLLQEDIDYCTTQSKVLATITGDDIASLFNKFNSVYPMYNRLYNRLPGIFQAAGKSLPGPDNDNNKATAFVTEYLGGANILANLSAKQLDDDIDFLSWVLDFGAFNIKLKGDQPDNPRNKELSREIASTDSDTKAKAILYVIYYVRCNIVHGQKHQEDDQRRLVSSVTRILEAVLNQLNHKLAASPSTV